MGEGEDEKVPNNNNILLMYFKNELATHSFTILAI